MIRVEEALNKFALDLINRFTSLEDGNITMTAIQLKSLVNSYLKNNDPVIWAITLEEFQIEAEQEIERRLTDIELNRLKEMFYDDDEVSWNRMVMIREAIGEAVNGTKYNWEETDKDYSKEKKLSNL